MNSITIHSRFQHRRATQARWKEVNPILREGEIGLETDTRRIKFGDGISHWNNLEYTTCELLPAQAERLGGITAREKAANHTVEVRIDPQTQRLYVPAYPEMPELATVATSGDYNDLENIPRPYTLPPAAETTIGGVAAAPKNNAYTVEVKKDPTSHKLYVPAAENVDSILDERLPSVAIRVVYKHQQRSTHFTNEEGSILNADIYFRPLCSAEYFNTIMPGLYFGLARCSSRHRQQVKKIPGRSRRSTQWHIVGEPGLSLNDSQRYPQINSFMEYDCHGIPWTYENVSHVSVASLVDSYVGEWIKFPHDLETVVRRFIYLYRITAMEPLLEFTLLPIRELALDNIHERGYVKICGVRNRTELSKPRSTASGHYASVNIGFCFSRYIQDPPNYMRYIFGPVAQKRAIVVAEKPTHNVKYLLKDSTSKKFIK